MIDPVIFSFTIGGITIALRWYGVLVMTGVMAAAWLSAKEIKRQGDNPDHIWDALVWIVLAGMVGSRLWYVVNATLGGSRYYLDNPLRILNITEGGLHFYGALLFGAVAMILYVRKFNLDLWLFLDALAPNILIGQAIARPANFINQELYGQPTTLPWGIPIDAAHRIAPYDNLFTYPLEFTRFHPTFAYEMLWNFFAAFALLLIARSFEEKIRPGVVFYGWLTLSGLGRIFIEFFRPDQPRIPGTDISFTTVVAILMLVAGLLLLLDKLEVIRIPLIPKGPDEYQVSVKADAGPAA
jgi:phosphatidylglycerol:prolipoprotein diacylglycerol transferase